MSHRPYSNRLRVWFAFAAMGLQMGVVQISGQVAVPTTQAAQDFGSPITLDFEENAPLGALISLVSERLGINFLYDDASSKLPFTLRAPTPVPQSQLLDVLVSVLQSKGLMLEDTDVPQLKRIVLVQAGIAAPQMIHNGKLPNVAGQEMVTLFVPLRNIRSEPLMPVVQPMLSKPGGRVAVLPDKPAVLVTDYPSNVSRIAELLAVMDKPADIQPIQTFSVSYGQASQLATTLQAFVQGRQAGVGGAQLQPLLVTPDDASNQIIISGPPESVKQIMELAARLDLPPQTQPTLRFYRLTNTVAADVLSTLRLLDGSGGGDGSDVGSLEMAPSESMGVPAFGQPLPPPAQQLSPGPQAAGSASQRPASNADDSQPIIASDVNTNSIIIVASSAQQAIYEQIIKELDQRRPQVMIETTVVSLDTSNGFQFGVDIGTMQDAGKLISFSSFGIAEVDPETGGLTPVDAPGGTLAILNPDIADIVIRALSTNSRSRLVSMPRVLVNDNGTGKLQSVLTEPFQRTVITDATTIVGEGANAEAGTTIEVTPHISTDDYLQLEYAVELSNFTGRRQPNLPPPSQKNTVKSEVTIPDGHTIVVGGLNLSNATESVSAVPFLGQIPIIEYLFSSRSQDQSNTTLFVFIRPVILRDDQFRDLKYFSATDRKAAELPDDLPESEPLLMRPVQ